MEKRNYLKEQKDIHQAKIDVVEGAVVGMAIGMVIFIIVLGFI